LDLGVSDCREVEPANRPGEGVHVKISFEEARAVRNREESARAGVSAEPLDSFAREADRLHGFGQELERSDVAIAFPVCVEDVREAIEETDP